MKKSPKFFLIALLVFLVFVPTSVLAQTPTPAPGTTLSGDQVIVGNSFALNANDTLQGNMLIVGGTATTAIGSIAKGDVVLIGGTLSISGTVNGNIVSIGGAVSLEDTAVINGSLSLMGASLRRSAKAVVTGGVTEQTPDFSNFGSFDQLKRNFPFSANKSPYARALTATFQALAMGIFALIIGLLLPHNTKNIAASLVREPLVNGGVGLLAIIVVPVVLALLMITIILIPVSLLGFIGLALAVLYGFIAVGYEVGQRFATLLKTTWHPSISAGIGTLMLSLVTGFANLIPCVGWILGFLAAIVGLGAVITSRVGSEKYANKLFQAVIPSTALKPSPTSTVPPNEPVAKPPEEPPVDPHNPPQA